MKQRLDKSAVGKPETINSSTFNVGLAATVEFERDRDLWVWLRI